MSKQLLLGLVPFLQFRSGIGLDIVQSLNVCRARAAREGYRGMLKLVHYVLEPHDVWWKMHSAAGHWDAVLCNPAQPICGQQSARRPAVQQMINERSLLQAS